MIDAWLLAHALPGGISSGRQKQSVGGRQSHGGATATAGATHTDVVRTDDEDVELAEGDRAEETAKAVGNAPASPTR